jgi:two-component sensor histidine kinase
MRYLAPLLVGADLPNWDDQRWVILGWMMWIPMTYIAVGLARLLPLNTPRWPLYAPLHLVGAVACSSIGGVLWISLIWGLSGGDIVFTEQLRRAFVGAVPIDSIIYFSVLAGVYGFDYYRLHKDDQRRTERLRAELAEAELTTLRTQLNPHFLFNALNAVAAHIQEHASEAVQMVAQLGDFLRSVLELGGKHTLSVDEEIGMLEQYLAVQRIRFGDALDVKIEIDPEGADAQVPSLVLQPLVENALHHGVRAQCGGGRIWITARRVGDAVQLRVMDDGRGPQTSGAAFTKRGIGLQNVEMRLRHLFGRSYSLSIGRQEHAGTTVTAVTIEVPYWNEIPVLKERGDGQAILRPGLAEIDKSLQSHP